MGAFVGTMMGILFHPIHFDALGMVDLAVTFVIAAIYYYSLYDEAKKQDRMIKEINFFRDIFKNG